MSTVSVGPAINPNENIHSWLKYHTQLVHKYYTNEKFRDNVTEGFLKLPNEIFMKSNERAERYRKHGNELFKQCKYEEALKEYNEAVSVANWQSNASAVPGNVGDIDTELTLDLSNRSAVLIKLQRYQEALADINQALNHVQTEALRKKLNFRREECLKKLSSSNHGLKQNGSAGDVHDCQSKIAWNGDNSSMSSSSSNGKASQDISKLDLVIKEKPELSLLKKDFYFTRCFNCLKHLPEDVTIPCRGCNQVKFCSYDCLDEAWIKGGHHNFCLFLTLFDHLINKDLFKFPPILACLQVLALDLDQIFQLLRQGKLPDIVADVSPPKHNDTSKLDKIAETAAHLLTYFTVIKRLPAKKSDSIIAWKHDIELFAGLLMMVLRRFERNTQTVMSTELIKPLDEEELFYLDCKEIGYAIYYQVKRLKHDCDPNTAVDRFDDGRSIMVRAIRDISRGEDITLDLGVNCRLHTVKERKSYLMDNFDYDCLCFSCEKGLQPTTKAFLCPKCSGPVLIEDELVKCLQCGKDDVLDKAEVLGEVDGCLYNYRQANLQLIRRDRDIVKAEDYLLDGYRRLKKILYPTNRSLAEICDRLSYCYKKMRKYKLSLIYAEQAFKCFDAAYHAFHRLRFNCFFTLLDRQRNFLVFCIKKGKADQEEFKQLFSATKESLGSNLKEARHVVDVLGQEKDYFNQVMGSIQQSLGDINL